MENYELLKAIRVELQYWKAVDDDTLLLHFKKVSPYTTSRDFSIKGMPISVFTEFGYLRVILKSKEIEKNIGIFLNEYLNNPYTFIEEEVRGRLTFWDGEHEDRYDWSSSGGIGFDTKVVEDIPITVEEWKEKYVNMALSWDKLHWERMDILQLDFLKFFVAITKGKINNIMTNTDSPDVENFKNLLNQQLNSWIKQEEDLLEEHKELESKNNIKKELQRQQELQQKLNEKTGFWQKFKNFWQ
jgi:hypothetical protein